MAIMFTNEEFHQMIKEVHTAPITKSAMLYHIVDVTVRPKITYLCNTKHYKIRGYDMVQDAVHQTFLHVCFKIYSGFLYHEKSNGLNDDYQGFAAWLIAVCKNVLNKMVDKMLYTEEKTVIRLYRKVGNHDVFEDVEVENDRIEKLREAVSFVLNKKQNVYKTLAWLGLCVHMLATDATKIESTTKLSEQEGYTLDELYATIKANARYIPWLKFSPQQDEKIMAALAVVREDGRTCGSCFFGEFFMTNADGERDGKKSISDWVYTINRQIFGSFDKGKE